MMSAADHLKNMRERVEALDVGRDDYTKNMVTLACADLPRLLDALERVLEVHKQDDDMPLFCHACDDYWPCPTVAAITAALEGKDAQHPL